MANRPIFVDVCRVGAPAVKVTLGEERTVQAALDASGMRKKETEQAQVDGENVRMSDELSDGDTVVLVKNIEGGIL